MTDSKTDSKNAAAKAAVNPRTWSLAELKSEPQKIAIVAPRGCGKTVLAMELARQLLNQEIYVFSSTPEAEVLYGDHCKNIVTEYNANTIRQLAAKQSAANAQRITVIADHCGSSAAYQKSAEWAALLSGPQTNLIVQEQLMTKGPGRAPDWWFVGGRNQSFAVKHLAKSMKIDWLRLHGALEALRPFGFVVLKGVPDSQDANHNELMVYYPRA